MPKAKLITDGALMEGASMPKIVAEFRAAVLGRKIVNAGYYVEAPDEFSSGEAYPCLVLDNGDSILIQCDDEGNGPGVPVTSKSHALCESAVKT